MEGGLPHTRDAVIVVAVLALTTLAGFTSAGIAGVGWVLTRQRS